MKLNITFTYHYIFFLGIALFLSPASIIRSVAKSKEIKVEKTATQKVNTENNTEVLHSEMLFRY